MVYLLMHAGFDSHNKRVLVASLSANDMASYILQNLKIDTDYYSEITILEQAVDSEASLKMDRHKEWDSYSVVKMAIV